MSLFKFDTTPAPSQYKSLFVSIDASTATAISVLKDFEANGLHDCMFISDAKFSSYQLLNYLLDKFGPSKVWITTYGISETVMRQIATRKQAGLISELHLIFSDHVKRIKPAEIQIAENIATSFKHYPCHAKIIVIQSPTQSATITCSMNMNRNNKLESGAISFNHQVSESFINYLNQILCS